MNPRHWSLTRQSRQQEKKRIQFMRFFFSKKVLKLWYYSFFWSTTPSVILDDCRKLILGVVVQLNGNGHRTMSFLFLRYLGLIWEGTHWVGQIVLICCYVQSLYQGIMLQLIPRSLHLSLSNVFDSAQYSWSQVFLYIVLKITDEDWFCSIKLFYGRFYKALAGLPPHHITSHIFI